MVLAFLNQVPPAARAAKLGYRTASIFPSERSIWSTGNSSMMIRTTEGFLDCASSAFCATARWPSLSISVTAPTRRGR